MSVDVVVCQTGMARHDPELREKIESVGGHLSTVECFDRCETCERVLLARHGGHHGPVRGRGGPDGGGRRARRPGGKVNLSALLPAGLGATGMAAGAFGAHVLADHVTPQRLETWETAARYHRVHAVVLLVVEVAGIPSPLPRRLLTLGVLLFSGSLYLLVLLDLPILGAVTPFGGLALIAGWMSLAWKLPSRAAAAGA